MFEHCWKNQKVISQKYLTDFPHDGCCDYDDDFTGYGFPRFVVIIRLFIKVETGAKGMSETDRSIMKVTRFWSCHLWTKMTINWKLGLEYQMCSPCYCVFTRHAIMLVCGNGELKRCSTSNMKNFTTSKNGYGQEGCILQWSRWINAVGHCKMCSR